MAVVYDELYISTMREIQVCRKNIKKLTALIRDLERKYNLTTSEFIGSSGEAVKGNSKDYAAWRESYEGLKNWEGRLREFNEILERHDPNRRTVQRGNRA